MSGRPGRRCRPRLWKRTPVGRRCPDGGPGVAGDDDLPTVGRRADARRGVHGQPDVPDIGQRRAAAVNPRTDADVEIAGPCAACRAHAGWPPPRRWRRPAARRPRSTRRRGRRSRGRSRAAPRGAEDASDAVQQVAVAVAQPSKQGRGRLDIGHQEGDESGGERRGVGRRGLDLAVHQLLLDDEAHGGQHGLCEARIVEDRRVVHERRHRPTLALEEGHAALVSLGRKRNGLARAVEIRAGRVGPVQDGEGRIAEDAAQALFELTWRRVPPQLDHEAAGRRVSPLRLQLPGDEADGHDAVLLRRVQERACERARGRPRPRRRPG